MVADGAMTGALFLKYGQACFCPTRHPGDIVITDNLRRHTVAGVKEALEAVGGHLRSLPPDSPDLNPLEKLCATHKARLRKAAPRTVDALWVDIGMLLDRFTPAECTRDFSSPGYGKT
jgi:transposase